MRHAEPHRLAGVRYFDITPLSRQTDADLMAVDGLHPSGKMYAQWVDVIFPEIAELFKSDVQ